MRGTRAVLENVVQPTSTTPIAVVWTHRVPFDNADATHAAAARFGDGGGRVAHFIEQEVGIGHMIARSLGWPEDTGGEAGAWDIYLYYDADARWRDGPPKPTKYFHQLWTPTEEPGFASGDDLSRALKQATEEMLVATKRE